MSRVGTIASIGLATLLAGILAVEYETLVAEDPTSPDTLIRVPPVVPAPTPSGIGAEAGSRVADILARPVFSASRRPPPGAASAAGAPVVLPRLTAVLVSPRRKAVIFAGGPDGRPVTVGEGERIGGYLVQSIGAGQATLLGPDGAHVLRPTFAPLGAPSAVPVTAQPSIAELLRQGSILPGMPGLAAPAAPPTPQQAPR